MKWTFERAGAFTSLASEWDSLNKKAGGHVLLDSDFVGPLIHYFGNDEVLIARETQGNSAALVTRKSPGVWETFQPSQAPIGLIVLGNSHAAGENLVGITRHLPGYALQLSALQLDPDYTSVPMNQPTAHLEPLEYIRTARITLNGSFEEYWKARGSNLRHNLARRRRRLSEKGYALEFRAVRAPEDVSGAIREYGLLEAKGWKAQQGTAVTDDNAQGRFYREVFERFCARRQAVIYQLLLNGRVAASDLCLTHNGMLVVLKTTYDEEFSEFSPAFLMREEELKEIYANREARVIEFYGRVMEWHTRWTDEVRSLYHVTCYRHSLSKRLLKLAKRFA